MKLLQDSLTIIVALWISIRRQGSLALVRLLVNSIICVHLFGNLGFGKLLGAGFNTLKYIRDYRRIWLSALEFLKSLGDGERVVEQNRCYRTSTLALLCDEATRVLDISLGVSSVDGLCGFASVSIRA